MLLLLGAIGLAVASLSTAPAGHRAWYWQNPYPQGNTLTRVAAGTTRLWAVGGPGVVLVSTDGGSVWGVQDPETTEILRAVDFVDDDHGWIAGDGGTIRATVDGGATWNDQLSGLPADQALRGVSMVTTQTGWTVGDSGATLKTTDGGSNWADQTSTSVQLNDISAVDSDHAWAVGDAADGISTIRATSDGGSSWTTQTVVTSSTLTAVSFVDTQTGYAVGAAVDGVGTILKTTDGGSVWTTVSASPTQDLTDVEFVSAATGWIAESDGSGSAGAIRYTTDGGATWTAQMSGTGGVYGLATLGMNGAVAVGENGMIAGTADSGSTWGLSTHGVTSDLRAVVMQSETDGWAVGASGTILSTHDGGSTWPASSSDTTVDLRGLDMLSAVVGWAVGDSGTIRATANGSDWTTQTSGVSTRLEAVDFVDANIGWAVGDAATILSSSDGGSTWASQDSGVTTTTPLHGASFVDTQTGWAWGGGPGVDGLLLHTVDGGVTWNRKSIGVDAGVVVHAASFIDADTGWIAGSGGMLKKTTDGGSNWVSQPAGTASDIYGLEFLDADTGVLVGGDGGSSESVIRRTSDGGTSWAGQKPGTFSVLRAVDFTGADSGWAVGDNGTILRTTDATAPETTMTVAPTDPDGSNGWYVTTPTVTLGISEPGIRYYSWISSAGPWSTYSVPFTRSVQGTSTLHYYSIDPGGNTEQINSTTLRYDSEAPATPATPTASSISTGTVAVSWPEVLDSASGVHHYDVLANGAVVTSSSTTSAIVSDLTTETAYSFSVIAVDAAGNRSAESPAIDAVTLAALPRPSLAVYARQVGSSGVFVDWGESTGTVPPVSYRVWRAVEGGPFSAIATIAAGQPRSYRDAEPPLFSLLEYRVSAVDSRGEGVPSEVGALSSTVSTALPAPVGVTARNTASVTVTWTPVPLDSVVGYHVYRSTASSATPVRLTVDATASASFHDTSTAEYIEYWYRVASVDTSGNIGVPSRPVHIRTEASGTVNPPHGTYSQDTDLCALCHSAHTSPSPQTVQLLPGAEPTSAPSALLRSSTIDAPLCLSCHDGTSASDIMNEYGDASRTSRHAVPVFGGTGTLVCASCHAVHSAAATDTVKGLISAGGKKSGNPFCYACHGADADAVPRGDLRGFDDSAHGTGVLEPPTGTKVVCLSCHVSHTSREASLFPYSGDDRCLGCHTAGAVAGASADIENRLSGPGADTRHDLLSADSDATRLACGNCHEPHTSSATTPCVDPDNPSTAGSISATGDTLCLKCHDAALPTSADTSGWVAAPLGAGGATAASDIASSWPTSVHGAGASVSASLTAELGFLAGDTLVCGSCHDAHGSPNRFTLLDSVRAKTGTAAADALLVVPVAGNGADLRFFCASCHELNSAVHPGPTEGGADLSVFPLDCTASGCHTHAGTGL